MTKKISYSSSWQFVFWDNEWYQVSLQQKYIDALHVYVLKHIDTMQVKQRSIYFHPICDKYLL